MILIPILAGLYLLGAVGYFKMSRRVTAESVVMEALKSSPFYWVYGATLTALTLLWPVSIYFTLVMEASKSHDAH